MCTGTAKHLVQKGYGSVKDNGCQPHLDSVLKQSSFTHHGIDGDELHRFLGKQSIVFQHAGLSRLLNLAFRYGGGASHRLRDLKPSVMGGR